MSSPAERLAASIDANRAAVRDILERETRRAEWAIAIDVGRSLWGSDVYMPRDRVFRTPIVLFPRIARLERRWRTIRRQPKALREARYRIRGALDCLRGRMDLTIAYDDEWGGYDEWGGD